MSSHANRQALTVVGNNVRRAREARGWTQRELAAALDTDVMQVSRWERGEHRPNAAYEAALTEVLFEGNLAALYTEPEPVS